MYNYQITFHEVNLDHYDERVCKRHGQEDQIVHEKNLRHNEAQNRMTIQPEEHHNSKQGYYFIKIIVLQSHTLSIDSTR